VRLGHDPGRPWADLRIARDTDSAISREVNVSLGVRISRIGNVPVGVDRNVSLVLEAHVGLYLVSWWAVSA
jgi:hypothetical protein